MRSNPYYALLTAFVIAAAVLSAHIVIRDYLAAHGCEIKLKLQFVL